MSKVKHTPTPWVFEPHGLFRSKIGDGDWPLGYISSGHDKPIFELKDATCWFGKSMPAKQLATNAAFIIQAVNHHYALIEALEVTLKALSDSDDEGLIEHADPMVKARRTLSLAKGEQA